MDADILAADAATLEKLAVQNCRDYTNAAKAQATFILTEGQKLLDPDAELRLKIVKAIAVNYMKPTTGTTPETIATDTVNDAARLKAAVEACVKIVKGL